MTTQHQQIRRLSNGTIDIDFYRAQALTLRGQARRDFLKGRAGVTRAVIVAAIMFGPLVLAGILHELKGGTATSAAAAPLTLTQRLR
jgi:hypothetical protein